MNNVQSLQCSGQYPPPAVVQPLIVNHPQMGQAILVTYAWSSPDLLQGKKFLEQLLTSIPVAMQNVTEISVPDWLKLLDTFVTYGIFGGSRGISFRKLTANVLNIIGRHLAKMPSDPATFFSVHQLSRSSPSVTDAGLSERSCFNPDARQEHFMLELIGSVLDQSGLPNSQKWSKDLYEELKASGEAMDASYITITHPEDIRLDKIYGTEWENLLRLKERLDPKRVFANAVPRMSTDQPY
jgi:hypothetical protein